MQMVLYSLMLCVVLILSKLLMIKRTLKEKEKFSDKADRKFNGTVGVITDGAVEGCIYAIICAVFTTFMKVRFNILTTAIIFMIISIVADIVIVYGTNKEGSKITQNTLILCTVVQVILLVIFFLTAK